MPSPHSGGSGGSSVGFRNGASFGHAASGSYQYHSPRLALWSHVRCEPTRSSAFARSSVRSGMPAAAAAAYTSADFRGPPDNSRFSQSPARSRGRTPHSSARLASSAVTSTRPDHSTTG